MLLGHFSCYFRYFCVFCVQHMHRDDLENSNVLCHNFNLAPCSFDIFFGSFFHNLFDPVAIFFLKKLNFWYSNSKNIDIFFFKHNNTKITLPAISINPKSVPQTEIQEGKNYVPRSTRYLSADDEPCLNRTEPHNSAHRSNYIMNRKRLLYKFFLRFLCVYV